MRRFIDEEINLYFKKCLFKNVKELLLSPHMKNPFPHKKKLKKSAKLKHINFELIFYLLKNCLKHIKIKNPQYVFKSWFSELKHTRIK